MRTVPLCTELYWAKIKNLYFVFFFSERFPASSKTGYDLGEREVRFFCSPRVHYLKPWRQNRKKQK